MMASHLPHVRHDIALTVVFCCVCITAQGCGRSQTTSGVQAVSHADDFRNSPEGRYFAAIEAAPTAVERQRLIAEFESVPVSLSPFHLRWFKIHDVYGLEGWTEEGYEASVSGLPRDLQLLAATDYGVADIENGGFDQFFSNPTGVFAPEMVEWFDRAGLPETAAIMREAMAVFGTEFPRSQTKRNSFLDSDPGDSDSPRSTWDTFETLNEQFYATLPRGRFNELADRWLRATCGIQRLTDAPPRASIEN